MSETHLLGYSDQFKDDHVTQFGPMRQEEMVSGLYPPEGEV